jgi:hypothetical protein
MLSRKILMAMLMAGVSFTAAHADDNDEGPPQTGWRPRFVTSVPDAKMKAAFPKGATVTGRALLGCVATKDGKLADCKVLKETPAGQGFGEAALSVVGYERIKTTDETGASVEGRPVKSLLEFLAPGDANPDWIRKPNGRDLANVFPKAALDKRVGGRATIHCKVTVEGFLDACTVRFEEPAGMNFGSAGLQLAPQFRLSPKIRGGKAVPGGDVSIPIIWEAPTGVAPLNTTPIVLDPPWTRVPTQAEVASVWPKGAAGLPSGQAALRCVLAKTGQLRSCDVISEEPRGKGFGRAAQDLSKLFQVNVAPDDKHLRDYKVDVPFRFRDPASPDNRKLTKPRWVATLTPEGMALIYPEAALKAKVLAGQAAATCVVTAEGKLSACEAARETPAGLDFGAAAVKAAALMRMNPWTKEGDTLDGLKVTVPFQFSMDSIAPAEPAKPAQGGQP